MDRTVIIWNLVTGKAVRTYTDMYNDILSTSINQIGSKVILGVSDKIIKVWDLKAEQDSVKEFTILSGHKSIVNSVKICEVAD